MHAESIIMHGILRRIRLLGPTFGSRSNVAFGCRSPKPTLRVRSRGARELWARFRVSALRARTSVKPNEGQYLKAGGAGTSPLSVNCIVFSKDRAMQLDACLRSIERSAPYTGPIAVVYKATTQEFAEGYRLLDLGDRARLVAETGDFRRAVMTLLDATYDYTVFHTDDDVFFRKPSAAPILPADFAAFSLRLGENTTHCYTAGGSQLVPPASKTGPVTAWDWTRAEGDFAYPMSLDGHIFLTCLLVQMLSRARFANPNQLEEELHYRRYLAPPTMLSFLESCLVSVPANIVSSTHRNRASQNEAWSPNVLNARFLDGERIDVDAMDFSAVRSAHQEIPLAFNRIRN